MVEEPSRLNEANSSSLSLSIFTLRLSLFESSWARPRTDQNRFWKDEETRGIRKLREKGKDAIRITEEDAARTGFLRSRLSEGFPLLSRTPLGCYSLFSSDFIFFFFLFSLARYSTVATTREISKLSSHRGFSKYAIYLEGDFFCFRRWALFPRRTLANR